MYSRLIAWLKILLPLGALALLSTIFLYARGPDPIAVIPVLTGGADPTQTEQMGSPFYAGTTENGQGLTLAARQARFSDAENSGMIADDLRAVIDVSDGNRIVIDATVGQMEEGDRLLLRDGVTLERVPAIPCAQTVWMPRSIGLPSKAPPRSRQTVPA